MTKTRLPPFQRARQPNQITARKEAILRAALTLFQENGLENVSLNDIAREVGSAKSNLYRYFESREHIYLLVLQKLAAEWESKLYPALSGLKGKGTVGKVAEIVTQAYMDSPEYSQLITVVNSVLEKSLTPELIVNFRSVFLERRKRLAEALAAALPHASAERMLPLTLHIFLHVPGLWTFCYPTPASKKLFGQSEYSHLKLDFKVEMTLFLRMILKEAIT